MINAPTDKILAIGLMSGTSVDGIDAALVEIYDRQGILTTKLIAGGKVIYLSETVEGKRHDKKLADDEGYLFPRGSKLWQDTRYQGYKPDGVTILQPKKKPRGRELTAQEKESNREISKQRIVVEHHIGGVKRARIVHDTFRNRKENYVDIVMETSCGLHNFRVTMRHGKVA